MSPPDHARRRGLFLALEGPEGAGKSTQTRMLGDWLRARGVDAILTREPGGTTAGEAIRRVLLESESLPARTELLLMLAARATLVAEVVGPALDAGRVVVTDRFALSTLAYQAYGRGLPLDEVERLNAFATDGVAPDLTLVLDVSAQTGAARRGRRPDRIERAGAEFHGRVVEAYRLLSGQGETVERVDGSASAEAVHRAIVARLSARFPETFSAPAG